MPLHFIGASPARPSQRIEWIPVERISVVNPRSRNKKAFKEFVDNIAKLDFVRF
jgi:ParB family chromosome partitioning protein